MNQVNKDSPSHYKLSPIQPWDYIAANGLDFFEGNVVKYITRWKHKNGVSDLKKVIHYTQKLIDLVESKETQKPMVEPAVDAFEAACTACGHLIFVHNKDALWRCPSCNASNARSSLAARRQNPPYSPCHAVQMSVKYDTSFPYVTWVCPSCKKEWSRSNDNGILVDITR